MNVRPEDPVIQRLIDLGEKHEQIRAMILTSSRCNPNAPVDILSDYDVEIYLDDPMPFVESDAWFESLGPVLAVWRDEWNDEDGHRWMRMVLYEDGTKMDIGVAYLDGLRRACAMESLPDGYDIGYTVLLDKDGVTSALKSPTYKAFILAPPTAADYAYRLESFWMDSTYVARYLWRDDIMGAKRRLDDITHDCTREMLELSIAAERGWTWKPGARGRGLTKALDPDTRAELIASLRGGDADDLWESLFRTTALFRKAAIKVADALGFQYDHDLDRRVTIYYEAVRKLDRQATDPEELARLLRESVEFDK